MLASFLRLIFQLVIIATLCLCGVVVCINVPFVTEVISRQTSVTSVYSLDTDSMVAIALAGRDFAIGTIGQDGLASVISTFGLDPSLLDDEMIKHLKDCTAIFSGVTFTFGILCIGTLICIAITGIVDDHKSVGKMLLQSSLFALLILNLGALWGMVNFEMLFNNLHTLLFYGGVWEFDANSLLICMYPENFWVSMGAVWIVISDVVSIITLVVGVILRVKK